MFTNRIGMGAMSLVLLFLIAYLCLALLVYGLQSHLMYGPVREWSGTPHHIGLQYEAVTFRAEDGPTLSAWYVPADLPHGVILFCHGNAGNISHRIAYLDIFHRLGLGTLLFDYRGFGASEGSPDEQGTYRDAKAAWDYLVKQRGISPDRIVLFGESMGGAIASWLSNRERPGALILQSAFTSVPDVASRIYPFLPVRRLARYRYNSLDYIRNSACPVLIVHSRDDEIVPFSHGQALFNAVQGPKEFLELRGDHNGAFLASEAVYSAGIQRFIAQHMKKETTRRPQ